MSNQDTKKIQLTDALLGAVCALMIWQTNLLLKLSEEVARLQVSDANQDRRIERLENAESNSSYLPSLRDSGAGLHGFRT